MGSHGVHNGKQNLYLGTSAPDSSASDQLSKSRIIVSFLRELCCCVLQRHSEEVVCMYSDQDTDRQIDRQTHIKTDRRAVRQTERQPDSQ